MDTRKSVMMTTFQQALLVSFAVSCFIFFCPEETCDRRDLCVWKEEQGLDWILMGEMG